MTNRAMKLDVSAARLATMVVLFCNGLLYATWGVSVPVVKDKFALSEGTLSLAMAAVAIGGIVTMAAAGRWIARTGSGRASWHSCLLMALAAAPILLMPNYPALLVLLFAYGTVTAANDVAANAQVAHLEKISGRSLIGSVHGSFSVGGLVGALIASAWAASSWPSAGNFLWLAGATVLVIACTSRYLKNEPNDHNSTDSSSSSTALPEALVRKRLRLFGVIAFAALVVEGAFYDWAAVYMREVALAKASWVGAGYAAFAVAMALGRLGGDWLRDRFSHQVVIAGSGSVGVTGLGVVLSNHSPLMVVIGFLITGFGLANFIPVLFSSAGKLSANAGWPASQGLAVTTRIAYVGLLAGPLLIGPVAELVGLRLSLLSLVLAIIAITAGWLLLSRANAGMPWVITSENSPPVRTRTGEPTSTN